MTMYYNQSDSTKAQSTPGARPRAEGHAPSALVRREAGRTNVDDKSCEARARPLRALAARPARTPDQHRVAVKPFIDGHAKRRRLPEVVLFEVRECRYRKSTAERASLCIAKSLPKRWNSTGTWRCGTRVAGLGGRRDKRRALHRLGPIDDPYCKFNVLAPYSCFQNCKAPRRAKDMWRLPF